MSDEKTVTDLLTSIKLQEFDLKIPHKYFWGLSEGVWGIFKIGFFGYGLYQPKFEKKIPAYTAAEMMFYPYGFSFSIRELRTGYQVKTENGRYFGESNLPTCLAQMLIYSIKDIWSKIFIVDELSKKSLSH